LTQQHSTIVVLEKTNMEVVNEQRKHMLEVEEHLESARSNFCHKAIIEEQEKLILDLNVKLVEAEHRNIVFMEQEEHMIDNAKNNTSFGGDALYRVGN
jgi:hypothetical protein